MHLVLHEAQVLIEQVKASCNIEAVDVVVCPPFTALALVSKLLNASHIRVGAQDLFWEPQGAFTGEISPLMLSDAGCRFVIIGHSERRTHFGESDASVNRKLCAALEHKLLPIVCIGETLSQREANQTLPVLTRQLEGATLGLSASEVTSIILAYEPVWAIGTGRNATPEQAQETHAFIRQWIVEHFDSAVAQSLRIQYGGSVNASNAASLLQQPDVDGALVGGASLKAEAFCAIVKAAIGKVQSSIGKAQSNIGGLL